MISITWIARHPPSLLATTYLQVPIHLPEMQADHESSFSHMSKHTEFKGYTYHALNSLFYSTFSCMLHLCKLSACLFAIVYTHSKTSGCFEKELEKKGGTIDSIPQGICEEDQPIHIPKLVLRLSRLKLQWMEFPDSADAHVYQKNHNKREIVTTKPKCFLNDQYCSYIWLGL